MDWWGVSENSVEVTPHVQSFFLVFKKNVFTNKAFSDFIFSIKKEDTKNNIIDNYEIGLSKHLLKSGFKYETYSKIRLNPTLSQKNFFQKEPLVLIKKTALQKLHSFLIKYVLKKINKNNYYPENCIIEYSSNKFKNKKIKDTIKAIRRLIISLKRKHGTIEFLGKVFKFRPL